MTNNFLQTEGGKAKRYLIVNADDFGLSAGVNKGIIEAHENGIVTSASLMVRGICAAEAAAYSRERRSLSLGLHFDLYEWAYRDEEWLPLYEVAPSNDAAAVKQELERQLEEFYRLTGQNPTHLDSHQHAHRTEPVKTILLEAGDRLKIPVRHLSREIEYNGNFYGQTAKGEPYPQGIEVCALIEIIKGLPGGITELACHPGLDKDLDTMYVSERFQEVRALCHPQVKATLIEENIELLSFSDFSGGLILRRQAGDLQLV